VVTPSAMAPSIVAFDEAGEPVALVELVDEHLRVLRGFRSA
ncbi:MAG: hypothetical protein JWN48_5382, partial [Myxococcaceae bacterium]|nr:hypothetical protein [Myxococcaceae bacterium]